MSKHITPWEDRLHLCPSEVEIHTAKDAEIDELRTCATEIGARIADLETALRAAQATIGGLEMEVARLTVEAGEAAQHSPAAEKAGGLNVKDMVNRFLGWKLPKSFNPDCGVSFKPMEAAGGSWPIGTNLFTADEAKVMFEHCVRSTASSEPTKRERELDASLDQAIGDRDQYHEWADKLAGAIAAHFGAEIGEHSNQNCPWAEALEVIENADSPTVVGAGDLSAETIPFPPRLTPKIKEVLKEVAPKWNAESIYSSLIDAALPDEKGGAA